MRHVLKLLSSVTLVLAGSRDDPDEIERRFKERRDTYHELLVEDQLQFLSADLQKSRPNGLQNSRQAYHQLEYRLKRKRLREAYRCMAENCLEVLDRCSDSRGCSEVLVDRMINSAYCGEKRSHSDYTWNLFEPVLKCYRAKCSSPTFYSAVPGLLSPDDIERILALKTTALQEAEDTGLNPSEIQEFRTFGAYRDEMSREEKEKIGAGHTVTYMHRVVKKMLPDIVTKLKEAVVDADTEHGWGVAELGFEDTNNLKLRNAELIEYNGTMHIGKNGTPNYQWLEISSSRGCLKLSEKESDGVKQLESVSSVADIEACQLLCTQKPGCWAVDWHSSQNLCNLLDMACNRPTVKGAALYRLAHAGGQLGHHDDSGSLLTIGIALSDPNAYDGGNLLFTGHCREEVEVPRLEKGSAVIWPSYSSHAVSPVSRGTRRVLVFEFWEFCAGMTQRKNGRPSEHKFDSDCRDDDIELPLQPKRKEEERRPPDAEKEDVTEPADPICVSELQKVEKEHGAFNDKSITDSQRWRMARSIAEAVNHLVGQLPDNFVQKMASKLQEVRPSFGPEQACQFVKGFKTDL